MHLHHDEVANLSDSSYIIEPCDRQISFMQASDDTIYNRSNNDTIAMRLSTQNTIVDQAQGMLLKLDSFSLLTTIEGFQDDHHGVIDLPASTFATMADVARCLAVVPGYGMVLGPAVHGPVVACFPGDYDVRLEQFHLHGS